MQTNILRICRVCAKEATTETQLIDFPKVGNICLSCKAEQEWIRRNPTKSIEDYITYKNSRNIKALRHCKICGKEAKVEADLTLFVNNKDAKFGRKNICIECQSLLNYKKNNEVLDVEAHILHRTNLLYRKENNILKQCRFCGIEAKHKDELRLFSKNGNICKSCYNIYDLKHKRKRLRNSTPKWITPKDLMDIISLKEKCSSLSKQGNIKYSIDHIYPLVHPALCGLNIALNMQILSARENSAKNNRLGFKEQEHLSDIALKISPKASREELYNLLGSSITYTEFLEYEYKNFKGYTDE